MNMKPIVAVAIALTVGIVTFSGVLIPAIESGVQTEDTFTNEGYYHMAKYETDSPSVTIIWDHTDMYNITIGDDKIALPQNPVFDCTIVASDDWGLRYSKGGTNRVDIGLYGTTGTVLYYGSTSNNTDMTITLNSGTATFDNGSDTPITRTYTSVYAISTESAGFVVMKEGNKSVYLNGDSLVYATGRTTLAYSTPVNININLSGTIDDGFTATVFNPSSGYTISNYVTNATSVNSYIDLYKFDSVQFDITNSDDETKTATYSQVIVPYEVTAEKSIHADASTILLFQTIPVFIVLGMIVAVVGVLYMKTRR